MESEVTAGKKPNSGVNPILAISIAIFIALITSGACLFSYWHSDARHIIELIQNPVTTVQSSDAEAIDTTSAVSAVDLDVTAKAVASDIATLKPTVDFNANLLTDAALGL